MSAELLILTALLSVPAVMFGSWLGYRIGIALFEATYGRRDRKR